MYLRSHWRGDLNLVQAFWINLVGLRILLLLLQDYTHPPFLDRSVWTTVLAIAWIVVFDLVLLVWQVRGALRAIDRWFAARGQRNTVFLLHLGIVFCVLMPVLSGLVAVQSLWFGPDDRFAKYKPFTWLQDYELRIAEKGTRLEITGDFKSGLAQAVADLLAGNPDITTIILESRGGRVAEGRALAELIRSKELATHVAATCSSACATAFIGGHHRSLGPEGRLGFHRFRLDAPYYNPEVSAGAQQAADLAFYTSQGLSAGFLKKVFRAEASEIWYPDHQALERAGVVHEILAQ